MWRNKSPQVEPVRVLVRHADAGLRSAWSGADEWRGLTNVGHQQAKALVGMLAELTVLRILSSPSLRCRQTVVPLALARALDAEPCPQLAPCLEADDAMALISDPETASSVLCTHRETLQALFERLAGPDHPAVMQSDPMEKAAVWILRGAVGGAQAPRFEYLGSGAAVVAGQAAASSRWSPDPRREGTDRRWPASARTG